VRLAAGSSHERFETARNSDALRFSFETCAAQRTT
jgi:hypothetical protein